MLRIREWLVSISIFASGYAYAETTYTDTFFVDINPEINDTGDNAEFFGLANLVSLSLFDGLLANGSRTGLGTTNPTGKQLKETGLYFQGLRIASIFDHQFIDRFYSTPLNNINAIVVAGPTLNSQQNRPDIDSSQVKKVESTLKIIFPELPDFSLKKLEDQDYQFQGIDQSALFTRSFRNSITLSIKERLNKLRSNGYDTHDSLGRDQIIDKLSSQVVAFAPLSSTAEVNLKTNKAKSYTRYTILMPTFHKLHQPDVDSASTWYLTKGISKVELPEKVDISTGGVNTAYLTHLSYLEEYSKEEKKSQDQVIFIELIKDFSKKKILRSIVHFGRLLETSADSLSSLHNVNTDDYKDALYVHFRPTWFEGYEIEARINKLTIDLVREDTGRISQNTEDENLFKPRYNSKESKISFRITRYTSNRAEKLALKTVGFSCTEERPYFCHDAYANYEEYSSGLRNWLTSGVIEFITGRVINSSIPTIETAIDKNLHSYANKLFDQFGDFRTEILNRLGEATASSRS